MRTFAQRVWAYWGTRPLLVGLFVAVLYGLPGLGYPYGRDQGTFHYVGQWWLEGFIPYKDSFDNKPPGIYLVYALSIALLGAHQIAIRVLDLLTTILTGYVAALCVPCEPSTRPAVIGASVLSTTAVYYTCFDYWDTAQAEHWEGLALLVAFWGATRIASLSKAAVFSGALAAVAILFKTPAVLPCLGILFALGRRALRQEVRTDRPIPDRPAGRIGRVLALFLAGGLSVMGITVGYFVAMGSWVAFVDAQVGVNLVYVAKGSVDVCLAFNLAKDFLIDHNGAWVGMTLLAIVGVLEWSVRSRDTRVFEGLLGALGMIALSIASVAIQGKYWSYHWIVVTPFVALSHAHALAVLSRIWEGLPLRIALGTLVIGMVTAPGSMANRAANEPKPVNYRNVSWSFWRTVFGQCTRDEFLRPYTAMAGYRYQELEDVGLRVKERAKSGDRLLVRGLEPTIYVVAGLRAPGRFHSDHFFSDDRFVYKREAWTREHEESCWKKPPRFVVTFTHQARDIEEIVRRGYRRITQTSRFVLLERL